MKIKEIIVVEGRDDTVAIKRAVKADTIETNGSAVNKETIEKIRLAVGSRGVIIFTDPDYPGQRIRSMITEQVSGCKHAFLPREKAIPKHKRGLGIEHANPKDIREALQHVYSQQVEDFHSEIEEEDLLAAELLGSAMAKERRILLGKILKIGYANGKQLRKRLQMFQITKAQFTKAIEEMNRKEEKR